MKKKITFKTPLHKRIFFDSSKHVFKLDRKTVDLLKAKESSLLTIGDFKFQLLQTESEELFLFKVVGSVKEKFFEVREDGFYLRGHKWEVIELNEENLEKEGNLEISDEEIDSINKEHEEFLDLEKEKISKIKEEDVSAPSELIKIKGEPEEVETSSLNLKDLNEIKKHLSESIKNKGSKFFDLLKKKEDEQNLEETSESYVDNSLFQTPLVLGEKGDIWFSVCSDFRNTDQFWRELGLYYRDNPDSLKEKINLTDVSELPPVFSRKIQSIDIPTLYSSFVSKLSERVDELEKQRKDIEQQIEELEKDLSNKGIEPKNDPFYQESVSRNLSLSEAFVTAKKLLSEYEKSIQGINDKTFDAAKKFYIDVRGNTALFSKYSEQVISYLLNMNLDVNELQAQHQKLEKLLIKRLKDVADARVAQRRIREIEVKELLEAYKEENEEHSASVNSRKRKEVLQQIGSIAESTASIQRTIENEKSKIRYYIDNLNSLEAYGNYEEKLFEHKRKKQEFRKKKNEFIRHVNKLHTLISDREAKFNAFFSKVKSDVEKFRDEVTDGIENIEGLAKSSVENLENKWKNEAEPYIEMLSHRSENMIKAFSSIPPSQIAKLYLTRNRLRKEAELRQKEWENIHKEIRNEFKLLGYELDEPAPSELDNRYLEKLDAADFKLTPQTEKILFVPKEQFLLEGQKDVLLGLEPQYLDDDHFEVIDQVWTTLTPEQEEKWKERREFESKAKREKEAEDSFGELKESQINEINKKNKTKFTVFERLSRPFSSTEKEEKMKEIESAELQSIRDSDNLVSKSRGNVMDMLHEITKKIFSTKSVRMVNSQLKLTDDGFVDDGGTEILSAKDYFIKSSDERRKMFDSVTDHEDFVGVEQTIKEPDADMIEALSDPEYFTRIKDEYSSEDGKIKKPTVSELVSAGIEKYKNERSRVYEVDLLKEKLLKLNDEISLIKKYHEDNNERLQDELSGKSALLEEMNRDLSEVQSFLKDKEGELEKILGNTEESMNISLDEVKENLDKQEDIEDTKPKNAVFKWLIKGLQKEEDKR